MRRRASCLDDVTYLFAAVLLEVVQQAAGVGEPDADDLDVVLSLLDDLLDAADAVAEQRAHLVVVVHVVGVTYAHEEDVGGQAGDVSARLARLQVCDVTQQQHHTCVIHKAQILLACRLGR